MYSVVFLPGGPWHRVPRPRGRFSLGLEPGLGGHPGMAAWAHCARDLDRLLLAQGLRDPLRGCDLALYSRAAQDGGPAARPRSPGEGRAPHPRLPSLTWGVGPLLHGAYRKHHQARAGPAREPWRPCWAGLFPSLGTAPQDLRPPPVGVRCPGSVTTLGQGRLPFVCWGLSFGTFLWGNFCTGRSPPPYGWGWTSAPNLLSPTFRTLSNIGLKVIVTSLLFLGW